MNANASTHTYITTSAVVTPDTGITSRTHEYRGTVCEPGLITSVDIGDGSGTVHFQGNPEAMLDFADRIRKAVAESIASYDATALVAS